MDYSRIPTLTRFARPILTMFTGLLVAGACAAATPEVEPETRTEPTGIQPATATVDAPATATPAEAAAPAPTETQEGERSGGELRIVWATDVSLFDPATQGRGTARGLMAATVMQGLTRVNPESGIPEPLLADGWEVSEDGLAWSFFLKDGIVFHDGSPLRGDTVVANIKRWLDPDFKHTTRSRLAAIEDVRAVDELTVEFQLSKPDPSLAAALGEDFHVLLSQKAIEDHYLEAGLHLPAGTGPFKLVEFVPGIRIVMERWDGYPGPGKAVLDRIVLETVSDDSARTARLLSGEAHLNLYQSLTDVTRIQSHPDLEILSGPSLRQWHCYINLKQPHLSDVRVRRALNHAVDQEALVTVAFQGFAAPRHSLISAFHSGGIEVDPIYEYDPTRALELLADTGWTKGSDGKLRNADGEIFNLRMDFTTGGAYVGDDLLGEALAGFFSELGIDVNIVRSDIGTFYGTVTGDEAADERNELVCVPFQIGFQDGATFFDLTYTERSLVPEECCNFSQYTDPEGWAVMESALKESDPEERVRLIQQAQRVLWKTVPAIPLPQTQYLVGKSKDLEGVVLAPNESHSIAFAWFQP